MFDDSSDSELKFVDWSLNEEVSWIFEKFSAEKSSKIDPKIEPIIKEKFLKLLQFHKYDNFEVKFLLIISVPLPRSLPQHRVRKRAVQGGHFRFGAFPQGIPKPDKI